MEATYNNHKSSLTLAEQINSVALAIDDERKDGSSLEDLQPLLNKYHDLIIEAGDRLPQVMQQALYIN